MSDIPDKENRVGGHESTDNLVMSRETPNKSTCALDREIE
jgi:hypothetical protein